MNNFEQVVRFRLEASETLNKLSYIAAGTISLSVTFIGYVISIEPSVRYVLREPFIWRMPSLYLLFSSWILLILTLFFGVIVRYWNARYLYAEHAHLLLTDLDKSVAIGDHENTGLVVKEAKKQKDRYEKISSCARRGTIVSFILGVLLLTFFAMVVINRVVNS